MRSTIIGVLALTLISILFLSLSPSTQTIQKCSVESISETLNESNMTIIVFVVKPDVEYAVGVRGDNVLAFLEERELGGTAVLRGNTSLTVYGAGAVVDVAARKCGVYEVAVIDVFRLGISLLVSFLALSVSYADYRFRYK